MKNPRPEWCLQCGRERGETEYACPACGGEDYGRSVPASARPAPDVPAEPLLGVLGKVMSMPRRYVLALHGKRGGGKSTVAFSAFARPHIVTSEMATDRVLRYLERLGVRHAGLTVARLVEEELTGEKRIDLGEIDEDVDELVLDSASATLDPARAVAAVAEWTSRRNARAIVILHQNKDGAVAGQASMLHACDGEAEVVIEPTGVRRVVLQKHREGELRSVIFDLGELGERRNVARRYYSVEGGGGHYRLVPYPDPTGSPHAEYLRAVERSRRDDYEGPALKLPEPPCAVAALKSALYGSGWIEPVDVEARKAFAAEQGVPYFSPAWKE